MTTIIKGWPLACLVGSAVAFIIWIYWSTAATYTLGGQAVNAATANGYCHTAAGQLDQAVNPVAVRACASAAEVESNRATP